MAEHVNIPLPELIVMRHGETLWNREGRLQGRLHSPLTAKGREQARAFGELLAPYIEAGWDVVTSPQPRALETAVLAFGSCAPMIHTDSRLSEVDIGHWQGRLRTDLPIHGDPKASDDGPLAIYEQAEGGETLEELRARCTAFLEDLVQPTLIVTHGITSRMLRAIPMGVANENLVSLPGGQVTAYHMENNLQRCISPTNDQTVATRST